MTNFTTDIKRELIGVLPREREALRAALSAYLHTSGNVLYREGHLGFEITTEYEPSAEFFLNGIESLYGVVLSIARISKDQLRARDRFVFDCMGAEAEGILKDLGVITKSANSRPVDGLAEALVDTPDKGRAYIQGAFLGGGSCTLPGRDAERSTGYHLEIVFPEPALAGDFCALLCDYEILAKHVSRGSSQVVYLHNKEVISDFLYVLGVPSALKKLETVIYDRDNSNNENRKSNCEVSNLDKSFKAAAEQCVAIRTIAMTIGLDSLEASLAQLAKARLALKEASLRQLAESLGISKSCLTHRMRKLMEIAKNLTTE